MQTIESQALAKLENTPSPQQVQAWTALAQNKNQYQVNLQARELELQDLLLKVDISSHTAIDEALATYRKKHSEMVAYRKEFTSIIDTNIVQPLMAFEKRADYKSNEKYVICESTSLKLRKEEKAKADAAAALEAERNSFIAHIKNEFFRLESKFINDLNTQIDTAYNAFLMAKVEKPILSNVEVNMKAVKLDSLNKFNWVLLTPEDCSALYASITPPNYGQILADKIAMLPEIFINYSNDLLDVEAAAERREQEAKLAEIEAAKKVEQEIAVNNYVAQAAVTNVAAPKIKVQVTIEYLNTPVWAKTVLMIFLNNFDILSIYVRVKDWSKLSIGQMTDAMAKHASETGETFSGLLYTEIEK
jgi:hypothetical protein